MSVSITIEFIWHDQIFGRLAWGKVGEHHFIVGVYLPLTLAPIVIPEKFINGQAANDS